jgi:hypothetical protein
MTKILWATANKLSEQTNQYVNLFFKNTVLSNRKQEEWAIQVSNLKRCKLLEEIDLNI